MQIGTNQLFDPQLEYFGKLTAVRPLRPRISFPWSHFPRPQILELIVGCMQEDYCCRTVRSLDQFKNVVFNYVNGKDYDLPESGGFGGVRTCGELAHTCTHTRTHARMHTHARAHVRNYSLIRLDKLGT